MKALLFSLHKKERQNSYPGGAAGILDCAAAFCMYYCMILFLFYNRYEVGQAAFEPVKYLLLFVIYFLIYILFMRFKYVWCAVISSVVLMVLTVLFYPINGAGILLAIPMMFYIACRFWSRMTYQPKLNTRRGYVIVAVIILHIVIAGEGEYVSSADCARMMSVAFVLYLVFSLGMKYSFLQTNRKYVVGFCASLCGIAGIILLVTQYMTSIVAMFFSLCNRFLESMKLKPIPLDKEEYTFRKFNIVVPKDETGSAQHSGVADSVLLKAVLEFVFIVCIVVLILYCIRLIYRRISDMKQESTKQSDRIVRLPKEEDTVYRVSGVFSKVRYGNSTTQQVRRIYRDTIVSLNKNGHKNVDSMTVDEIEEALAEKENEEVMQHLSEIYRQARYSNMHMDPQTVHTARKLSGIIKKGQDRKQK